MTSKMTASGTILVADDDHAVRSTLKEILQREGYDVIEAEDGDAALEVLRDHEVSVVVLDIRMPRRDGIAVLDALEAPPKVLLLSAFSLDTETRVRLDAKVFKYLRKPVPPERLLKAIAEAFV